MGILAGVALALLAVYLVLQPLLRAAAGRTIVPAEPLFFDSDDEDDPILARKARALAALKEIDFDRATGKLSDEDYERMKVQFTNEALEALKAEDAPAPATPVIAEPVSVEAMILKARSSAPVSRFCLECGEPVSGSNRFCLECGTPLGAATP